MPKGPELIKNRNYKSSVAIRMEWNFLCVAGLSSEHEISCRGDAFTAHTLCTAQFGEK